MMRVLIYIILVILTVSAGAVGYYRHKTSELTAALSSAEQRLSIAEENLAAKDRALAQAREARAVLESHYDRVEAEAEYWRQMASDLSEKEGADEALNPYERAVLDSLRLP